MNKQSSPKIPDPLTCLDPRQKEAVMHQEGPLAVIAGPGTGKTRVLTLRIYYLIEHQGVSPDNVLAVTFTNQASREISQRLEGLLGHKGLVPRVCTFHQWALDFLKTIPNNQDFNPIDEEGAKVLYRQAQKARGATSEAQKAYKELLRSYRLWDFEDLILEAKELLHKDEELRISVQNRYSHVLVDEFQDLSPEQYELVRLICPRDGNITVIGDPDQAIYGFRGASPKFLMQFSEDFDQVTTIELKTCFRSPQIILDAAKAVIQRQRELVSAVGRGKQIQLRTFNNPMSEAKWVATTIERLTGGIGFDSFDFGRADTELNPIELDSIGVLFRARSIARELTNALSRQGIPFLSLEKTDPVTALGLLPLYHLVEIVIGRNVTYHMDRLGHLLKRDRINLLTGVIEACKGLSGLELLGHLCDFLSLDRNNPGIQILEDLLSKSSFPPPPITVLLRQEADLLGVRLTGVRLLSLHAAKGLEFEAVFIIGCDEGVIPWPDSPLEEEKRLFYVGLTRSTRYLYLSSSARKTLLGRRLKGRPSGFLETIPKELLNTCAPKKSHRRKVRKEAVQMRLF